MTKNTGAADRAIRLIIGLALIGLTLAGMIGAWGWLGVVPLLTAVIGWCPAYKIIGVSTCKSAKPG